MSLVASRSPGVAENGTLGMRAFAKIIRHAFAAIAAWRTHMRQRRELLTLNAVELRELSLTEADINREGSKPFWASVDINGR